MCIIIYHFDCSILFLFTEKFPDGPRRKFLATVGLVRCMLVEEYEFPTEGRRDQRFFCLWQILPPSTGIEPRPTYHACHYTNGTGFYLRISSWSQQFSQKLTKKQPQSLIDICPDDTSAVPQFANPGVDIIIPFLLAYWIGNICDETQLFKMAIRHIYNWVHEICLKSFSRQIRWWKTHLMIISHL